MRKKSAFLLCTVVIIVANLSMILSVNSGEEIVSNIFAIAIVLFLLPGFLWTINNDKVSWIRVESCALLMLATISVMRFINRIDTVSPVINSVVVVMSLGLGILLIVVAIIRRMNRKK